VWVARPKTPIFREGDALLTTRRYRYGLIRPPRLAFAQCSMSPVL